MLYWPSRSRAGEQNVLFFWIFGYEPIRELGMNQSYNKKNYLNACVRQRAFKNN